MEWMYLFNFSIFEMSHWYIWRKKSNIDERIYEILYAYKTN